VFGFGDLLCGLRDEVFDDDERVGLFDRSVLSSEFGFFVEFDGTCVFFEVAVEVVAAWSGDDGVVVGEAGV